MTASSGPNRPPPKAIGPDGSTRTIPERQTAGDDKC